MKNYIISFLERYNYPLDAKSDLLNAYDKMRCDEFKEILDVYEQNKNCDYALLIDNTTHLAEKFGVHKYTAHLLLFICLSKQLGEYYKQENIDEEIFYNSMNDLLYKLLECRAIHGINGIYVANWYKGFFKMTCFAICRLHFEIVKTHNEVTLGGRVFPTGTKAIGIHIPRTGTKLTHEDVLTSYCQAAKFFAKEFENQPILFTTGTWLLDPWLKTVLPESSNLLLFGNDFKIVETIGSSADYIAHVVFGTIYNGNPKALPQNTTLQRAYVKSFEEGKQPHTATGIFLYENNKIIK